MALTSQDAVSKTFTPKFIALIVGLFVLGGAAFAGIWYWQNQQLAQEIVSTFTPRPSASATPTIEGRFCGGIAPGAFPCPTGYSCKLDGNYPDAGGKCTRDTSAGQHCGGNMQNAPTCDTGYHCAPVPGSNLPFGDVGGICVKN